METGTLEQIGAMDGDKVLCLDNTIDSEDRSEYGLFKAGWVYTYAARDMIGNDDKIWPGAAPYCGVWRIISRAAQTPELNAITTPFGLLDEPTQEALRAHGGPYEYWYNGEWIEGGNVGNLDCWAWRVQPQPESETITCYAYVHPSGIISKIESDNPQPVRVTFNRINGVIDLASYRVEPR